MIIIKDYGVELHQLTEDKIEMVRQWRNSEKINRYMEFRGEISPEMQAEWFKKVSQSDNQFYFIIQVGGKDVGLINIKNVDWNLRTGESGIFIFDDSYLHVGASYRAALCQRDFAFRTLHLHTLKAHILNTNSRSIKYNQKFGFVLSADEEQNPLKECNQMYLLDKEDYFANKINIINMLREKYNFTPPHWLNKNVTVKFLRLSSKAMAA